MTNKQNILVVDDETSMREFLGVFLSKHGYKVSDAKNGSQALKMIQKNNYDLILTDIRLGDITGLEVLREAKKKNPDIVPQRKLQWRP
jgi:two-component system response regulator PilR (NtrC family)